MCAMEESVNARRHTRRTKKDFANPFLNSVSFVRSVIVQIQERSKIETSSLKLFKPYLASLNKMTALALRAAVPSCPTKTTCEQFSLFSWQLTEIKLITKLLWPVLTLNSRYLSLIWLGTCFGSKHSYRPTWWQSTSESPDADNLFLA